MHQHLRAAFRSSWVPWLCGSAVWPPVWCSISRLSVAFASLHSNICRNPYQNVKGKLIWGEQLQRGVLMIYGVCVCVCFIWLLLEIFKSELKCIKGWEKWQWKPHFWHVKDKCYQIYRSWTSKRHLAEAVTVQSGKVSSCVTQGGRCVNQNVTPLRGAWMFTCAHRIECTGRVALPPAKEGLRFTVCPPSPFW